MASRTNKYASLNFNDIYEKKNINPSNNPSFSAGAKTALSNSRIHGNMLVLTRPSPKPTVPHQSPPPPSSQTPPLVPSFQDRFSDSIGIGFHFSPTSRKDRPLGRTGSGPSPVVSPLIQHKVDNKDLSPSPKTNRFVPPHLRPGFAGREEKQQQPEIGRTRDNGGGQREGRPKSGGGLMEMKRPGSGGGGTRL